MKLFLDTANVDEIRKANEMGVICGVTTNPILIAKEGRDYAETLKEICGIVDGPISGEVKATTEDAVGMIKEGREIFAIDPKHMVVKIPMTLEGLKAIKILSAEGIPTNCTLIFSTNQALLAARAGATKSPPLSAFRTTSPTKLSPSSRTSPMCSPSMTTSIPRSSPPPCATPLTFWAAPVPVLISPPCPSRSLSRWPSTPSPTPAL